MAKSLLYMMEKNIPRVSLILLLIASMTLMGVPRVNAQVVTKLSVNPSEITVPAPGQSFQINVTITNVTDFAAFEFKLGYNTTLLDAVYVYQGDEVAYFDDWIPINITTGEWTPTSGINDTIGQVWAGAYTITPFTGDAATLITINFTATAIGNGTFYFIGDTVVGGCSGPPDYDTWDIYHTAVGGNFTVEPEFPATIVMPLLLIATLAAALLGKMVWSRKRKDALTAE